jgi:hypothetical protein
VPLICWDTNGYTTRILHFVPIVILLNKKKVKHYKAVSKLLWAEMDFILKSLECGKLLIQASKTKNELLRSIMSQIKKKVNHYLACFG